MICDLEKIQYYMALDLVHMGDKIKRIKQFNSMEWILTGIIDPLVNLGQ